MPQQVKTLATKPDDPSWSQEPTWWMEWTTSTSWPLTYAPVCVCTHTCTHTTNKQMWKSYRTEAFYRWEAQNLCDLRSQSVHFFIYELRILRPIENAGDVQLVSGEKQHPCINRTDGSRDTQHHLKKVWSGSEAYPIICTCYWILWRHKPTPVMLNTIRNSESPTKQHFTLRSDILFVSLICKSVPSIWNAHNMIKDMFL